MKKSMNQSQILREINNKAARLILEKKYKDALRLLKSCLKKYPNSLELNINTAAVYQSINKPQKAVDFLEKALEINPSKYELYPRLYFQKRKVLDWKNFEAMEKIIDNHPETQTPFIAMLRIDDNENVLKSAKLAIIRK